MSTNTESIIQYHIPSESKMEVDVFFFAGLFSGSPFMFSWVYNGSSTVFSPSTLCEVLDSVERPVGAIMAWEDEPPHPPPPPPVPWGRPNSLPTGATSVLGLTGLPGKIEVDFWEGWEKKVGFELGEIGRSLFLTNVNKVRKMVDVIFGAVLCKVAPSTSLSQSMLGCRVGMLGLPEFSGFDLPCSSPSNWYLRSDIIVCKKNVEYSRFQDLYTS